VYLAGRGLSSLQDSITRLKTTYPDLSTSNLHPLELDLSSIATSVAGAKSFLEPRLDILIANAGIALDNNTALSSDGWERHFQTNHLGHFAFITTLLPLVEDTAQEYGEARIAVVASVGYTFVNGIDFDAIRKEVPPNMLGFIGGMKRYGRSKLANILFALEIARRLRERGVENVWVNAVHPGEITLLHFVGLVLIRWKVRLSLPALEAPDSSLGFLHL
jgi:NAD(P)-dependent dehydrogenase (short-subunit alcohol dehydrogenase family)